MIKGLDSPSKFMFCEATIEDPIFLQLPVDESINADGT